MEEYDYIVVGSGAAGSIVAGRLGEDASVSVLVLEAGPPEKNVYTRMPAAFRNAIYRSGLTWDLESEPDPGLGGRRTKLLAGKVIGGSATINSLLYQRGFADGYDAWRDAGCVGWGYADLLPYFKRAETSARGEGPIHGGSGPLSVAPVVDRNLLREEWQETLARAGYQPADDANGPDCDGYFDPDVTVGPNGVRSSPARGYLFPAIRRGNVRLRHGAEVSRVVVESGHATGVAWTEGGEARQARARREVIVAAGSYQSPKLLMLSGIGPAEDLRAMGITVVAHSPKVGANLSNHAMTALRFAANRPSPAMLALRWDRLLWHALRWQVFGTGFLATVATSVSMLCRSRPGLNRPDALLNFRTLDADADPWFPGITKRSPDTLVIGLTLIQPKSRGWVRLASPDPRDAPRIFSGVYSADADLAGMVGLIGAARQIAATRPIADRITHELPPYGGASSDEEIAAALRRATLPSGHPVGTCAIGAEADAVVGPDLKVRGVEGLRVADASVLPNLLGAGSYAPTVAVGEKAADLIRGRTAP